MNVLFLDQYSALGGAQQCLLDLMPAIEERGWCARAALPPGGPLVDLLRGHGVGVEKIQAGPYRCGKKSAGDLLRFGADVPRQSAAISKLLDQPTDLVYVNGPRLLIAAAHAAHGRVPVLFHAHHCIAQRSAAMVEGMALRYSGATVAACCDWVARPLRDWIPEERIHVIPNGTIDFGFRDRTLQQKREVRIGIVGRIAPEKGQVEFLEAAARVAPSAPHARFVICGAPLFGDRDYDAKVRRLAAGLEVEFLDWQDDAIAVIGGLDILVIASKQEGMPRVLLEAFSAGVPVVAFPAGGIKEVIRDGSTGFLTHDLAAALTAVLESDSWKLRAIARNARHEWEQHYTVGAYRDRIAALMEHAIKKADYQSAAG